MAILATYGKHNSQGYVSKRFVLIIKSNQAESLVSSRCQLFQRIGGDSFCIVQNVVRRWLSLGPCFFIIKEGTGLVINLLFIVSLV